MLCRFSGARARRRYAFAIRRVYEGRARRRQARAPTVIVPALPGCARKIRFVVPDQADLPCPVRFEKIFLFFRNANQVYDLPSHPE
jgi:hypothetical protein